MIFPRRAALLCAVAALAACRARPVVAPAPESPELTVSMFLAAVNARALDRMALLWGNERGPSTVSNPNSPQVQRRQLEIMQRVLMHDSLRLVRAEPVVGDPAKRLVTMELVRGNRRAQVPFTVVPSRSGGWLVFSIDLDVAMVLVRPGT